MKDIRPGADVTRSDLVVAALLTAAVFGGSALALAHARLEHHAQLPAIDPGIGVAIAVRPMADLPGTGPARARQARSGDASSPKTAAAVPRAWQRRRPQPRPPGPVAASAEDSSEPRPPTEQPAVDPAAVAEEPSDPPSEPADPTVNGSPAVNGSATMDGADGGPGVPGEQDGAGGGGDGDGDGDGGGSDPLLARAVAFYRARLVAWFSARFRVTGSGLTTAQLSKYRARARIEIGEDLRIVDFRILSSDHPAFDGAARSTLEGLRGESLPPPPENYPGAVQRQLTVTFTCTEDTCD